MGYRVFRTDMNIIMSRNIDLNTRQNRDVETVMYIWYLAYGGRTFDYPLTC